MTREAQIISLHPSPEGYEKLTARQKRAWLKVESARLDAGAVQAALDAAFALVTALADLSDHSREGVKEEARRIEEHVRIRGQVLTDLAEKRL